MGFYEEVTNKFELAKQNKLKFFCHTEHTENDTYFLVEDVKKQPDWAELCTNRQLYHISLRDCVQSLSGTMKPIVYHNENINPYRRSVLLHYNIHTGQVYPDIEYDDSKLKEMEASL